MPDAVETITQWTLRGDFGKRAQRAALTNAEGLICKGFRCANIANELGG
jgi:hypothetical protein